MRKLCRLYLFFIALFLLKATAGNSAVKNSENHFKSQDQNVLASFKLVRSLPQIPDSMMIYKTVTPEISRQDITKLKKASGIEGQIVDRENNILVKGNDMTLEVFKQPGTGYIRFSNDAKLASEEEAKNLLSENDAIAKAKEFLQAYDLFPENTYFKGVQYSEFKKFDTDGKTIEHGKNAIVVGFGFKIEGKKVAGPGAKAGVVFGDNGEIIGFSKIWREIKPHKFEKVITPEEAFIKFKQKWPQEAKVEQLDQVKILTEVNIKDVLITYYAEPGSIPQEFIEPVYIFRGDYQTTVKKAAQEIKERDSFEIVIPAVLKK